MKIMRAKATDNGVTPCRPSWSMDLEKPGGNGMRGGWAAGVCLSMMERRG